MERFCSQDRTSVGLGSFELELGKLLWSSNVALLVHRSVPPLSLLGFFQDDVCERLGENECHGKRLLEPWEPNGARKRYVGSTP